MQPNQQLIEYWEAANAHLEAAERGENMAANLQAAVANYLACAKIERENNLIKDLTSTLNNLGNAYRNQAEIGENPSANLASAVNAYTEAAQIMRARGWEKDLTTTLNNLGIAYQTQAEIGENPSANLASAVDAYTEAAQIMRARGWQVDYASTIGNLGTAYITAATLSPSEAATYRQQAADCYRQSVEIFSPDSIPSNCLKFAHGLGNLGFNDGNWELAVEGYEIAMKAIEKMRSWAHTDAQKQKILEAGFAVYANAIQSYVNLGNLEAAITTSERARSRRLVELMASNDLYKNGNIPEAVRAYLQEYQEINNIIDNTRRQIDDNTGGNNQKTLATTGTKSGNIDLKAVDNFLVPYNKRKAELWQKINLSAPVLAAQLEVQSPSFDEIRATIPNSKTAILSFFNTAEKIVLFIVRQDSIFHYLIPTGYDFQGWLYREWLIPSTDGTCRQEWAGKIPDLLREMSKKLHLDDLVTNHLQNLEELIIIPHICLHLIPFAALPMADDGQFFGDLFRLRYAPSAQVLKFCHDRVNQRESIASKKYGIVEDATGDLVWASYESQMIGDILGGRVSKRLQNSEATLQAVREMLTDVNACHFSHHANSDFADPLESRLCLHGNIDLTLGELMVSNYQSLLEVFMSCCQTNVGNPNFADDFITLGTGFLCAGALVVVSTLWSVYEDYTALFCIEYYQLREKYSPSKAMQEAQFNLRNMTGKELKEKWSQIKAFLEEKQDIADTSGNRDE